MTGSRNTRAGSGFRLLRGSGAAVLLCCLASFTPANPGGSGKDGGSPDLIELLHAGLRRCESVQDYSATFYKQQRIRGVLHPEEKIYLKFKKPFMMYMKWIGDVENGREALFVRGRYGNMILVHLGGIVNYFAPSFLIHPTGALAMRKNLRPITEAGIGGTTRLLLEVCEAAREKGDLQPGYTGEGSVGGRPTYRFERLLPKKEGYPAHRTLIEIDRESAIPLSVISYGWDGELMEKYVYEDLRLNAGLTEKDFERTNREYGFGYIVVPVP